MSLINNQLRLIFIFFAFLSVPSAYATDDLLSMVDNQQLVNKKKVDAALAAAETVKQAGAYIDSFTDLFTDGIITLPVGIRKGDYELIIREISYNTETDKNRVLVSCAFPFKESGSVIAFEGYVDIEGQKGMGTSGSLELITPVKRTMGSQLTLIFNRGTKANFGCEGIESFYAKLDLLVTSERIKPVDSMGKPTGGWLSSSFDSYFDDFDNFSVSFDFNHSFAFEGLDDFVFTLRGATLDQSDNFTPATVQFPEGYGVEGNALVRNLWKGVAVTNASVTLPGFFNKPGVHANGDKEATLGDRFTLALENVIIDNNGFSGRVITQSEIFSSDLLDKDSWDISLSEFSLKLLKGSVDGLAFGGDINIPPFGKNSLLPYHASFNYSTNNYEFQVGLNGSYELPVLGASVDLNRNSYIEILLKDGGIYPTINACGILSVDAPLGKGDNPKKLNIPDIPFENMRISRAAPYFEIGSVGITGGFSSPEIAGFELIIKEIEPFSNNKGNGLAFKTEVKLSEVFAGEAGIQLYGNYSNWKFDRVDVDHIIVGFNSGAYSINGEVEFKNGDEVYGSGFRGDVELVLIDKFKLDAVAVFGKKDDYRYFLTDVFFETAPGGGIILAPTPISFYGFGGGLYRKMQQSYSSEIQSDFGKSLSGINYIPDKTVGMGFMTSTKFGMAGVPSAFNAKVGFEIQFNSDGGLNFVQLRGDVAFMNSPDKFGVMADNINSAVKKMENSGGKIKLSAKSDLEVPENSGDGILTASILMEYDAQHKVFTADLNAYLNAGFIKGVGTNNRMGWASIKMSDDEWYAYLGTPTDRLGVEIIGLARADGYFMLGDNIPELPLPPQKVLKNFSQSKQDKLNKRSSYELSQGSGIAFGQSLHVDFKAELVPFYAKMGVGMGAEFLLKNYGANAFCAGGEPPLGIDGWYARAQAWAYVEADIGLQARVFGKSRKFSILDISASTLLEGAGPNPFYFSGAVGGRFSVMGGLVSGRCNFDFEIGDECKVMGGSPFGEDIIAQLTPSTGEKDVNVFVAPQAVFNIPVGLDMEVEEDEGQKAWYRVTLDEFKLYYKNSGKEVKGYQQITDEGRILVFEPDEALESQSDLIVRTKVGFERRVSGTWNKLLDNNGKPIYEEKEVAFKSGDRPKSILPEHVKYSYPVNRQYNFYAKEHDQGYLMVTKNYNYLFTTDIPEGYNQELQFRDADGKTQKTSFTFKSSSAENQIRMEINFPMAKLNFKNNEIYQMALLNVPKSVSGLTDNIHATTSQLEGGDSLFVQKQHAEGSLELLQEDEIYAMHFRTSSYDTFVEKMENVKGNTGTKWQLYPHVYELNANLNDNSLVTEVFDEVESNQLDANDNTIHVVPLYGATDWYINEVNPLMYGNTDLLKAAGKEQLQPPMKVEVASLNLRDKTNKLSDDMLKSNGRASLSKYGALTNNAPRYIDRDYKELRTILANTVIAANLKTANVARFLATNHIPDQTNGIYGVEIRYVLPGKGTTTSTINRLIQVK